MSGICRIGLLYKVSGSVGRWNRAPILPYVLLTSDAGHRISVGIAVLKRVPV